MNRIEVLVADDHSIIRNGLRNILDDSGDMLMAGEAWDGNSLLDQVRERDWDLLVLDLSMPGRSGLDLIKLVKAERPHLPILIFTMHQEEQYAVRAIRAGASGYLTKEEDADLLLQAMRKVAAGGVYLSAKVAELLATDASPAHQDVLHTRLSNREFEIFSRIVRGMSLTDIATEFALSIKTVSTHKSHIMEKLGAATQVDMVRYAIRHGLIDDQPDN